MKSKQSCARYNNVNVYASRLEGNVRACMCVCGCSRLTLTDIAHGAFPGADPGFRVGGAPPSRGRQHTILPNFPKKIMHEIELPPPPPSATDSRHRDRYRFNDTKRSGNQFIHLCEPIYGPWCRIV